jgi:glutamate-1-semialdehyde 2,1-aminomutase
MFGCYFNEHRAITSFAQVMESDVDRFRKYFHHMLSCGVYLAPSAFEAGFVSSAHGVDELRYTLNAAESAFASLKS